MSVSHFTKNWGAEPVGDNRWRFRLWAPGLSELRVRLANVDHPMDRTRDGWFEGEFPADPDDTYAFILPDGHAVADPAARAQAGDVHGPSKLVDPRDFEWRCDWKGRPWHESVIYELHVGAFSPGGNFDGARERLDYLAETGITAIELCPVAQFSGERGWGYDGVLLYAPHPEYGGLQGLKRLVDAAHERGLMIFLDVVYNHFGPDGNYLHLYAPEFFDPGRQTPWGAAIAFEEPAVRNFFIENALYWLQEYRIDGLRLDAIDQITDPSAVSVLEELARTVRRTDFGRTVHLTTEDDRNVCFLHARDNHNRPLLYDGEWNDDFHHVTHVLATGETDGYYGDYADDPRADLMTALGEGYVHQGRKSPYRNGSPRGEPSAHMPPVAFVNFLQNHDQTGNRAFGERLTMLAEPEAVEVLTALLLLAPTVPLLFMGEEWGEKKPFQFFCDFEGALGDAVREGRRREFSRWAQFADKTTRETIPDPNDPATFDRSRLDWAYAESPQGRARRTLLRELLRVRAAEVAPRLPGIKRMDTSIASVGERGITVSWLLDDGTRLNLVVNLGGATFECVPDGRAIFDLRDPASDPWALRAAIARSAP
ncbi:MAG: malto-oligosyltrehalose trehalohydrolase [Alphaproteobacteria bacterium]